MIKNNNNNTNNNNENNNNNCSMFIQTQVIHKLVVDDRATQDIFQSLKEIKICYFHIPLFRLFLLL